MENSSCTIVMYHYVRDLTNTAYPGIKGLDTLLFIEQIEYLQKHYHFVTIEEVIDSFENKTSIPPNSVLLTFDDGYIDHFNNVFPILERKKIQGSFYIPVETACENKILDVNKIHYILAKIENKQILIDEIYNLLDIYRTTFKLESNDYYFKKLAVSNRYDSKEVIFIKRLLQVELEEKLRTEITGVLFRKYVTSDEKAFSRELYMNEEQISCMQRNGMHIGGHGNSHYWLGSLNKKQQQIEIEKSMDFIQRIGGDMNYWTMCYPYGNYNDDTLNILRQKKCKLGLTTKVDTLDFNTCDPLTSPRLDTNDIPKNRNEHSNDWFKKISAKT